MNISQIPAIHLKTVEAGGIKIFYREAGPAEAPVLLLLHGFPTSSHMFRHLMPRLASDFRVIAPDLPGFGFTEVQSDYRYTFDNLAVTLDRFAETLNLERYAIYIFDYGAPTGLRLAMAHPEKITAIITQNGNAYVEGLGDAWDPIKKYWKEPTADNREAIRGFINLEGTKFQYLHGAQDPSQIEPESYWLDAALLQRPGNVDIQLDLFLDYANNIELYPAFQEYFRKYQPPLLAVWGKNDPFFIPAGAEAFRKDIPTAKIVFYDTGHFALETHVTEISKEIFEFLTSVTGSGAK
jgi:pimeloyl-ACP methyl ester carboxylesterase